MAKPTGEQPRLEITLTHARIIRNRGEGLVDVAEKGPVTVHILTADAFKEKLRRGEIMARELVSILPAPKQEEPKKAPDRRRK